MKILHVTADWKWTGPAEPMLHGVRGLRERGHHVDLAVPTAPPGQGDGVDARARERGLVPVHELERGQGYRPWRDRIEVRRLRAIVSEGGYDVLHAHHTRDHLIALRACAGLPTRIVVSWHHGEPISARPWHRWLFSGRRTGGVALLGERIAERSRQALGRVAPTLGVVPGCVDTERFAPRERSADLRAKLGLAPDQRVIGLVARLQPHRRVDLLLDALARALADAPGLRLLVLGRGTHQQRVLTEPVARMGLGSAVLHPGYLGDDYLDALALMDALVFLVPGSDGSCRAVLEAMSMEVPVIASRRGILPETVRDAETGALVDEDPEALAAAFTDLWREPARWQARGKAARRAIVERHGIAHYAECLERLYADVLGGS